MLARDGVVYEFDCIRIDPLKRTVGRDGVTVPIPARAFEVLLLLVQRHGELVPKEEILSRVWPDTHVDESSLPVMISAVRRAIGDDGRSQKYIKTISKCGYRLATEVREISVMPSVPSALECDEQAGWFSKTSMIQMARPALGGVTVAAVCCVTVLVALSFLVIGSTKDVHVGLASVSGSTQVDGGRFSSNSNADMWYQKGRYAWDLQTKASILQAVEYYRNAVAADPNDALAWAGLAESYVSLPSYSEPSAEKERDQARSAAARAVLLNDHLADSHIALGMVSLIGDRNFTRGEDELRKAIALNPKSPLANGELGLYLVATGQTSEAIAHGLTAKKLDPLSIRAATDLGTVFYYSHRFAEAEAEFKEVLKLDPYSYRAHINLGKNLISQGRFEEAQRTFEEASFLSNHDPLAEGLTAEAIALKGDVAGARSILAHIEERSRTSYVAPISLAFAYAGLGEPDTVLVYLKKARADRTIAALYLRVEPAWEILHGDPRFRKLLDDIPDAPGADHQSNAKKQMTEERERPPSSGVLELWN